MYGLSIGIPTCSQIKDSRMKMLAHTPFCGQEVADACLSLFQQSTALLPTGYLFHAGGPSIYSRLGLPVDPLLGTANTSTLSPPLTLPLGTATELIAKTAAPSVVITEGIPPISVKMIEKICRWEFIDLSKLLLVQDPQPEDSTVIIVPHQSFRLPLPKLNNSYLLQNRVYT